MTDPRLIFVVSVIFAAMGVFSLSVGFKRIRAARLTERRLRWYKQVNLLTGIEYILLAVVFPLTYINRQSNLAPSVANITRPLYAILLICAAIIAGLVIHRGLLDLRASRAKRLQATNRVQGSTQPALQVSTKENTAVQTQRRRERRKNAAAARRRRAGKA
jgi:hypothetical protein